jgi:hypothetical protein
MADTLNLDSMTVAELTATYNELTGKSLKKFDTKAQGIARVKKLLEAAPKTPEPSQPTPAEPATSPKFSAAYSPSREEVFPIGNPAVHASVVARKALVGETVPVGRVKKIVTKTTVDGVTTNKVEKVTVSSTIRKLILDGLSNDEIWKIVQPQFDLSDSKKSYPAWYRRELNK